MSRTIRRTVTALALAGILATATRPVAARGFTSARPAPPPRAARAGSVTPGAPGALGPAWAWLHQLWVKAATLLDSTTAPAPPPTCTGSPCPNEGPIIDPDGGKH